MAIFFWAALSACGASLEEANEGSHSNTALAGDEQSTSGPSAQPQVQNLASGAPQRQQGLCATGETKIFECSLGRKMVAICAGAYSAGRYVQYRYGVPGNLDLLYPARTDVAPQGLSWASTGYSGGGEAQVRFEKDGFEYVVYSRVIRTAFGPDGRHDPRDEAGVLVRKKKERISDQRCASGSNSPEDAPWVDVKKVAGILPEGKIVYHDSH